MLDVAIVIGSTRPGRKGEDVARWVHGQAQAHVASSTARFQLVDIASFGLPLLDEPSPASTGKYTKPHTLAWSKAIEPFDAYVFVTPEYNHSIPASLKNALDYLSREWHGKAAAFVSYGASASGARAVEHLRAIVGELQMADVRAQVNLSTRSDWDNGVLKPAPHQERAASAMFDALLAWGGALKGLRPRP